MEKLYWRTFSDDDQRQYDLAFARLFDFCSSTPFRRLILELLSVPEDLRHDFVEAVVLSKDRLAERGVIVPQGLTMQRTQFYDERPTLFCVTHKVDIGPWKKLTVTFDNSGGAFRPVFRDAVDMDRNTIPVVPKYSPAHQERPSG